MSRVIRNCHESRLNAAGNTSAGHQWYRSAYFVAFWGLFPWSVALAGRLSTEAFTTETSIPSLNAVLFNAGWTPVPELSGTFLPGRIFVPDGPAHVLATADCVKSDIVTSTYTGMELVTQLQLGVQVQTGVGKVGAEAGLVKSLKFAAPSHLSIPSLSLYPTPSCRSRLEEVSLSGAYVVREALVAEIAEQTCGRVDAQGRFAVFGQGDVELAQSCARESLEPVVVAVRSIPLDDFLSLAANSSGGSTMQASHSTDTSFSDSPALIGSALQFASPVRSPPVGDSFLERVKTQAASVEAAKVQLAELRAAQQLSLDASEALLLKDASESFAVLRALYDSNSEVARPLIEEFVERFGTVEVSATIAGDTVSRPVVVAEVEFARLLLAPKVPETSPTPGRVLESTGMRMVPVAGPTSSLLVSDTDTKLS